MKPIGEIIRSRSRCSAAIFVAALASLGLVSAAAHASFHLDKIREVYPGTTADRSSQYVVLQMPETFENLLGGQKLVFYNPAGAKIGTASPADVASRNQGTVLFATTNAVLGVPRDFAISFNAGRRLKPAGGAACWAGVDCVSWGSFRNTSGSPLPSPAGRRAAVIPDGDALVRTIELGCSTMLEVSDDTNSSSADFSPATPQPRSTATSPAERPCPNTTITAGPSGRTTDRTPRFAFRSSRGPATFKCRLDDGPFRRCSSPNTLDRVALGKHTFKVRAASAGSVDPSPARRSFNVVSP